MEVRQFACLTVSLFKEYYLLHARLFSAVAEISRENQRQLFILCFLHFQRSFLLLYPVTGIVTAHVQVFPPEITLLLRDRQTSKGFWN